MNDVRYLGPARVRRAEARRWVAQQRVMNRLASIGDTLAGVGRAATTAAEAFDDYAVTAEVERLWNTL